MKKFLLLGMWLIIVATLVGCSSNNMLVKGNELPYVKKKLELGMTKADVKELFGRNYTNVYHAVNGSEVWRYDWAIEEGYVVVPEQGMETVAHYDREGFQAGKLSSQLFISWTRNNVVKDVIVYYMDDGEIKDYMF